MLGAYWISLMSAVMGTALRRETGVKIMNTNQNQSNRVTNNAVIFESLEGRELMSASHHHVKAAPVPVKSNPVLPAPMIVPLTINQDAGILQINGTPGSDKITVKQSGNVYTIQNGLWSTTITGTFTKLVVKGNGGNDSITLDPSVTENADIYGGAGNDTLTGGSGNDRIFAGAGNNVVDGGAGNDTIITLGSSSDTVTGSAGTDTFWMDASATEVLTDLSAVEKAAKHEHRVGGFLGGVSTALNGQTFAEPTTTNASMVYKNFSNQPLFSDKGPSEDDINQGYIGDCWYLSSLSSVAKVNPDKINQSVVDLGDGTYAVQFTRNGQNVFARVDGNLATWGGSSVAYAKVTNSQGNSALWVAIMEKAMTQFMGTTASYKNIDGGWMSVAYDSMGLSEKNLWSSSVTDLVTQLDAALTANKAVTLGIGSVPAGAPLIGGHAYTVDHLNKDATGKVVSITLRNPWGVDGAGNDGKDDGYVTATPAQVFGGLLGATAAIV